MFVDPKECDPHIDDRPIDGWDLADCVPTQQDTVRGRIAWRQAEEVPADTASAIEEHVRLLFEVKNARLYSFRVE